MGKPLQVQIGFPNHGAFSGGVAAWGCAHIRHCCTAVFRAFSLRCVVALLLGACVLLPSIFCLPRFPFRHAAEFVPKDPDSFSAEIQASFILQKPISSLVDNVGRLEYDILEEIGVPDTKVSVISMQSLGAKDLTHVVFGVLPDPKSASISSAALSVLRSSFVGLVLQQLNLSLTPSIFGRPSSFDVHRFTGGITVIPLQTASIWERTQSLFNFKLNSSINMILKNLNQLSNELKVGLNLRSYENVYVEMTNWNGSTVTPPVTVQASVLSDIGSGDLLPGRLKQLAVVINETHPTNLGLNHSIFGKVKEVHLSSYLKHISLAPSPSPSPSPTPIPSPSPNPAPSQPPSQLPFPSPSQSPSPSPSSSSLEPLSRPPSPSPFPVYYPYLEPPLPSIPVHSPVASAPQGSQRHGGLCLHCGVTSPTASPPYASSPESRPETSCSSGNLGVNSGSGQCYSPAPSTLPVPFPPGSSPSKEKPKGLTPEPSPAYSSPSPGSASSPRPMGNNGRGRISMSSVPASPAVSPSSISCALPSFLTPSLLGLLGLLLCYALCGPHFVP